MNLFKICGVSALFLPAAIAIPTQKPRDQQYSNLVVFGDSFSDDGNGAYKISNDTWPADPAYFGGRFSNGPVWVEKVATNLSVPLYDYAVGGSTTSNQIVQGYTGRNSSIKVPSTDEQVETFLKSTPPIDFASTLFVVSGGANDVFFTPNISAFASAAELYASIQRLQQRGAKHFVLLNYPDLSLIPYDSYVDVGNKAQLHKFSTDFEMELVRLQKAIHGSIYVDLLPLWKHFYYYGEPEKYGFDQFGAYGSCLTGAYMETMARTLCDDPEKKVFWDEYHPTAHGHRFIAQEALRLLKI